MLSTIALVMLSSAVLQKLSVVSTVQRLGRGSRQSAVPLDPGMCCMLHVKHEMHILI